jgi:hypothetical protein
VILDAQDGLTVRYARDLRLDDLKHENAILLGTHESDPWVELFENSMNFTFRNDLAAGATSMVNRHPRAGELATMGHASVSTLPCQHYGMESIRAAIEVRNQTSPAQEQKARCRQKGAHKKSTSQSPFEGFSMHSKL